MFKACLAAARCRMRTSVGDPRALYSWKGFSVLGDELLRVARVHRMPLSMAIFDFKDLLEAQDVYAPATFERMFTHVIERLLALAGKRGLVAHTGAAEFTVVLPSLNRRQARAAIAQCMGFPARVEFEDGRLEILLVPDVEVDCAGPDIERAVHFHAELRADMDEAHVYDAERLKYLAREREWHSQPTPLRGRQDHFCETPAWPSAMPTTLPALLARH